MICGNIILNIMKLTEDQRYLISMRKIDNFGNKFGYNTKVLLNNIYINVTVSLVILWCGIRLFISSYKKGWKRKD